MVEFVITHKRGIKLSTPTKDTAPSVMDARLAADKNDWQGVLFFSGKKFPLRLQ